MSGFITTYFSFTSVWPALRQFGLLYVSLACFTSVWPALRQFGLLEVQSPLVCSTSTGDPNTFVIITTTDELLARITPAQLSAVVA
jgi:hypothetical protein